MKERVETVLGMGVLGLLLGGTSQFIFGTGFLTLLLILLALGVLTAIFGMEEPEAPAAEIPTAPAPRGSKSATTKTASDKQAGKSQPKVHQQDPPKETTPWENADHNLDLTFEGGGSFTLGGRVKEYVERNINPGESVQFYIVGQYEQTIVALQDRLLVVKCGMWAGATFGGRVTSFYYRDINGIEVNMGLLYGVIEVNTPSYQGTQTRDFWNAGSDKSGDDSEI